MPASLYLTGTAGCGKTTLVSALYSWLSRNGIDVACVNLDPGVERLPYPVSVDCRDWISISEIMDEYDLGPNGAQVVAADLLAVRHVVIFSAVQELEQRYVLFDTPGQLELFAFRSASRALVEGFGMEGAMILLLFDPLLSKTAQGFTSLSMLAATVQFRMGLPVSGVLTKTDLLRPEELDRILAWSDDPDRLLASLMEEEIQGMTEASSGVEWFKALETLGVIQRLMPTSSTTGEGIPELHERLEAILPPTHHEQQEGWREPVDPDRKV